MEDRIKELEYMIAILYGKIEKLENKVSRGTPYETYIRELKVKANREMEKNR